MAESGCITKISKRTIRYNTAQIRGGGRAEHRCGKGRPRKITSESKSQCISMAEIGQVQVQQVDL